MKKIHWFDNESSVFNLLSDTGKKIVSENTNFASYKKGEIIFKEGDTPSHLLCLSAGKVKIIKEGVGGREQIIRMASPVGFIGYRALFAEQSYMASAVAIEDATISQVEKKIIYELLNENIPFALGIIKVMARELGFSNNRTVTLTQKHIRGRLAESLLLLIDKYGYENDDETIKVYLSRDDLADLSNMTTSNAIRILSAFASENVISIDGRKLKIIDIKMLQRISDLG